jgi:hypothetical protein
MGAPVHVRERGARTARSSITPVEFGYRRFLGAVSSTMLAASQGPGSYA